MFRMSLKKIKTKRFVCLLCSPVQLYRQRNNVIDEAQYIDAITGIVIVKRVSAASSAGRWLLELRFDQMLYR